MPGPSANAPSEHATLTRPKQSPGAGSTVINTTTLIRAIALSLLCTTVAVARSAEPATPSNRVLTAWLEALDAGNAAALQAFDAQHRPDAPDISVADRLRTASGGFT